MTESIWLRVRFRSDADDPRPIKFPPPGPYWITGYADDGSYTIIVAYVKTREQVEEYWPEAEDVDPHARESIIFTTRFPRPDWWPARPETT